MKRGVFLHQTPMFHAASMTGVLGTTTSGGLSTFVPAFDTGHGARRAIDGTASTMTVMVPVMITLMMMHHAYDPVRLRSLRSLGYRTSPIPIATLERLHAELPEVDLFRVTG